MKAMQQQKTTMSGTIPLRTHPEIWISTHPETVLKTAQLRIHLKEIQLRTVTDSLE